MPYTVRNLLTDAMEDLGAYGQGEVPSPEDMSYVLGAFNRMMDSWNAQKRKVYNTVFQQFTLVPGLQPFTVGPAALAPTYTIDPRPVEITAANVILNNVTPYVKQPINIRTDQFWQANPVPTITTTWPTDLYYSPSFPLGQGFLWPIPTIAYGLELWFRQQFGQNVLQDEVVVPQGYKRAMQKCLSIEIAPAFRRSATAELVAAAKDALGAIEENNDAPPLILTTDSGIPDRTRKDMPSFNWRTGGPATS